MNFDLQVAIENKFLVLMAKPLGGGSFGQIYKSVNIETKEEIAVKVVNK